MSGTSLVLLAMYSTVDVVGPASRHLAPGLLPYLLALLMTAAALSCAGLLATRRAVRHSTVHSAPRTSVRRIGGPGERRR